MTASARRGFLFLECDGLTGRADETVKRLKNRHAQLCQLPDRGLNGTIIGHAMAPTPVQIRFRSVRGDGQPETYSGRCTVCKKRRKVLRLTSKCRQCEDIRSFEAPALYHGSESFAVIIGSTPYGTQGCAADIKALHYFLTFGAIDLSGYLPGHFWDRLVPQVCQSEPIARTAVVAVSNAHLDHFQSASPSQTSLASYQAAVKKLRTYMVSTKVASRELVLLCCLLLFTFDRLRGENAMADVHLRSAMSILTHAYEDDKTITGCSPFSRTETVGADALDDLAVKLVQMDIEDTMPVLDRGPLLPAMNSTAMFWQEPTPMKFWSPHEFPKPWMHICHAVWTYIGQNAAYRHLPAEQIPQIVVQERDQHLLWVQAWRNAYEIYTEEHPMIVASELPTTSDEELDRQILEFINALIIESHYHVIKGVVAESLRNVPGYAPFDGCAEKMLHCGERALSLRQAYLSMHNLQIRKTFSTHVGIVECLLLLSHRTTSPAYRLRAQLLIRGFREVTGELTGVSDFFSGYGAPPNDFILIYEKPGH